MGAYLIATLNDLLGFVPVTLVYVATAVPNTETSLPRVQIVKFVRFFE
jgi:hypothetical protein